jgi:UDP-N-acetyl-D-glucosamine dehydrogenase
MLREFLSKVDERKTVVGVVGLGYVGLPLAIAFAGKGFGVIGFDVDPQKPEWLLSGRSYLKHIPVDTFEPHVKAGRLTACTDFARTGECDALFICVPTPLTANREPDVSFVRDTARTLSENLRRGQLVVLESTTYPGTTDELVREVLQAGSGLTAGEDFFLVYSPEREDPGNPVYSTHNIPKIVGGYTPACREAGCALYGAIVEKVVPVSSTRVAELAKLFENVYRAVNIALVNELKLLCQQLGLDVWEVIAAAETKPFGFQAFWPGPGLGGHCIPIDPFYLAWKARQVNMSTRFVELAGEINTSMPAHVVARAREALNARDKNLRGAKVLVLGVAYKRDVDDMRESPALTIIDLLTAAGAQVLYHDPLVPELPPTRKFTFDLKSSPLSPELLKEMDCVLVVTDHRNVDYDLVAACADLVVDTRNVMPRERGNVVGA